MAEETRLSTQGDDVARLRADIETTRAAMSDTLSQIQERLNPARLKEQARETVREATIGRVKQMARNAGDKASDAGRGIIDVMRDNPLPLAMIGLGAGWLLMNSRRRGRVDYHHDVLLTERAPIGYESGYTYDNRVAGPSYSSQPSGYESAGTTQTDDGRLNRVRESVGGAVHNAGDRASEITHRVGERVSDVGDTVRERAGEVRSSVRSAASNVAHRIGDVATGVGARVSDVAGSVASRSQHAAQRANYQYQETPWIGAAVALGLGVAAGLAIPGTDRESELMGDRRDELMQRAREMGREKLDAVRTVASEVVADAKQAVRETARDLKESAREHAREEGLVDTDNTGPSYSSGSPV